MGNFYKTSTRAGAFVFALVLAGSIFVTVGKPIRRDLSKKVILKLKDPLIALPNQSAEQQTGPDNNPPQVPSSQVGPIYSVIHELQLKSNNGEPQTQIQTQPQYQLQPQYRPQYETLVQPQQVQYYQARYQVVQDAGNSGQSHDQYAPSTDSSPEYQADNNAATKNREQPSEIIYVETNDETKTDASPSSPDMPSTPLSGVGSLMFEDSNLPATILTEVPVKDMPQEVLEKLKKEFGVKVVATRERPGANLVINCEEYAGQENNICSKQNQLYFTPINHQTSYSYPERAAESPSADYNHQGNSEIANEQPHIPHEPSNNGQRSDESQPETYAPREAQTNPLESKHQENVGRYHSYGIRNNAGNSQNENQNSDISSAHGSSDSAPQSELAGQPERAEAQQGGEPNCFDESSNGANGSKHNQQYDS